MRQTNVRQHTLLTPRHEHLEHKVCKHTHLLVPKIEVGLILPQKLAQRRRIAQVGKSLHLVLDPCPKPNQCGTTLFINVTSNRIMKSTHLFEKIKASFLLKNKYEVAFYCQKAN